MIYQTVNETDFVSAFADYGRADQFSVPARQALFEYYDSISDDTAEGIELDVIAICCDWCEFSLDELRAEYPEYLEGVEDFDEMVQALRDNMEIMPVPDAETVLVGAY